MFGSRLFFGALAALVFALAACDSGGGEPPPLEPRSPVVSDLAFSPDSVFFDDAVAAGDTAAAVDLQLSVQAEDDGAIDRVAYTVQGQFAGTVAEGTLEATDDGRYAATVPIRFRRVERGRYTVLVYAVDDDGLLSNRVQGVFELAGVPLGPPVIDTIDAPGTFQQPGRLQLVAEVSDPDGLENIARVEVVFPPPFSNRFQLFDDGDTSDDAEEGDGRYTVTFENVRLPAGFELPFDLGLTFRAIDRDGLASDEVLFTVTFVE